MVSGSGGLQAEAQLVREAGSGEMEALRAALGQRTRQLIELVKNLCALAAAEKTPGAVSHDARSHLFRASAAIYESLASQGHLIPPSEAQKGLEDGRVSPLGSQRHAGGVLEATDVNSRTATL